MAVLGMCVAAWRSCPDCEHRLFKSLGAGSLKCPKASCLKYLNKASLSTKSPEELEYEKEINVRGDLEKVWVPSPRGPDCHNTYTRARARTGSHTGTHPGLHSLWPRRRPAQVHKIVDGLPIRTGVQRLPGGGGDDWCGVCVCAGVCDTSMLPGRALLVGPMAARSCALSHSPFPPVWNLVTGNDEAATLAKVEAHKRENAAKNKQRLAQKVPARPRAPSVGRWGVPTAPIPDPCRPTAVPWRAPCPPVHLTPCLFVA
jgi:hypothetical protein